MIETDLVEDVARRCAASLEAESFTRGDAQILSIAGLVAVSHAIAAVIEEAEKAREKGKEAAGSYGVAKAKQMSQMLRKIIRDIKKTNSTLVIISQVRENLNPAAFAKKYRAGTRRVLTIRHGPMPSRPRRPWVSLWPSL